MTNKSIKLLGKVILFAILGIIAGIILGGGFGAFISWVVSSIFGGAGRNDVPPMALGTFLGMGAGAIVSGIFGGVIGYKD